MGSQLRQYQVEAISSWENQDFSSILEMATGTGKTLTAVNAALSVTSGLKADSISSMTLVVCPYLHLVDQWAAYFKLDGLSVIEACESRSNWESSFAGACVRAAKFSGHSIRVVATQATFMTPAFQKIVRDFPGDIVFIADEVHNFGTAKAISCLPKNARFRLGLSATPERWLDPQGTQKLLDYFGPISFKLSIKDAITLGCLSRYIYLPRVVSMSEEETDIFVELSEDLGKILKGRSFFELNEKEAKKAGGILRLRSALLGDAAGKWPVLHRDLTENTGLSGQLVYCAEGKSPLGLRDRQIDRVRSLISREKLGKSSIYEATTPRTERQRLISEFVSGNVTHLLSMRCLDEGVDIPSASIAYFISSSANPRQFVQRRGRVLRNHPNKATAVIYDYFLLPKKSGDQSRLEAEKVIGKRELARTLEFIDACDNREEALRAIEQLRIFYG